MLLVIAAVVGIVYLIGKELGWWDGGDPPSDIVQQAARFSGSNSDWTPATRTFDGVEMVLVPRGCFTMGSDNDDEMERPAHRVCLTRPYWMDRTEITNAQFAAFGGTAGATSHRTEADFPRTMITRDEALRLCTQRGGRLATEAEWEYAARGPDSLLFPWGNTFLVDKVVYSSDGSLVPMSAGSKPSGQSWVGALDLSGSVWEWVLDFYAPYPNTSISSDDPLIEESDTGEAVIRGGSFTSQLSETLRTTHRLGRAPDKAGLDLGFRCVIPIP